jgi:hypothetical protein
MLISLLRTRSFHRFIPLAVLAAVFIAVFAEDKQPSKASAAPDNDKAPEGFTAIFNGKDFTGWHGRQGDFDHYVLEAMPGDKAVLLGSKWMDDSHKHWRVENDELVSDGNGPFLTTNKDYGDMELLIDYKMLPRGDSGIYLRATPQVQIWDYTRQKGSRGFGAEKGSGGLWNNSKGAPGKDPLVLADKPLGEWNHFRILMLGERVTVYLNDKLVVNHARLENYFNPPAIGALKKQLKNLEVDGAIPAAKQRIGEQLKAQIEWLRTRPLPPKGPIQLQTHGSEIRWRNIYLREIPAEEANKLLREKSGDKGFEDVFNGKDFDGWAGPVDKYEVKNGAIVCKPHEGGLIYTKQEYSDFVARLEFKLPPRGNNGLAIRYPGGMGDTAYDGMCELQVLDDADKGIDPRQAHGSAYGMVAAHRGYQRPIGEWNYQEVTVKGSTIKVELNGTLILDCDLSRVHEFMGSHPHPGKDRTSGHFGFAGHNDPVEFRNIEIKRLDKEPSK